MDWNGYGCQVGDEDQDGVESGAYTSAQAGAGSGYGTKKSWDLAGTGVGAGTKSGASAAAATSERNVTVPGMKIGGGRFVGCWSWRIDDEASCSFYVKKSR